MEIMAALQTIKSAIEITKGLRDIEKDIESSTYKSKIAELYDNLADVKMALTDAKEKINDLEAALKVSKLGEHCPICEVGHMKIISSKPHPSFSFAGIQLRQLSCESKDCTHKEERMFDPRKD